jgi:hypothetical protein
MKLEMDSVGGKRPTWIAASIFDRVVALFYSCLQVVEATTFLVKRPRHAKKIRPIVPPSERQICRSRNGRALSATSVSLARFSIAARIMSIFWS